MISLNYDSSSMGSFSSWERRSPPVSPINLLPAWLLRFLLGSRLVLLCLWGGRCVLGPLRCSCICWHSGDIPSSMALLV